MLVAYTRFSDISAPCGLVVDVADDGFTACTYRRFHPDQERADVVPVDGAVIAPELEHVGVVLTVPQSFAWDDLIALAQGHDHACIVFPLVCRRVGSIGATDTSWQWGAPYNRTRETVAARRGPREHAARTQEHTLAHFYVPHGAAAPEDCALHLIVQDGFLAVVTGATAIEQPIDQTIRQIMPILTLPDQVDVPKDGYATIPIQARIGTKSMTGTTITAHLEETGGYLPLRRISISDGSASFKVGALGLEIGDAFRIKAGFRFFPGAADVVCTVV